MFGARRVLHDPFLMDGLKETMDSIAPYAGPVTSLAGTMMQYRGARDAGRHANAAAQFEAAQLEQNAGQAQAAAQRKSAEERRKGRFIASRALAVLAASGGASSPDGINIISDIDAEAMYRSQLALYSGDERARGLRMAAAGRRYTGEMTQAAYNRRARSSVIGGASLFAKYTRPGSDDPSPIDEMVPGQYGLINRQYG